MVLVPGTKDAFYPVVRHSVKMARERGLRFVLGVDVYKAIQTMKNKNIDRAIIVTGAKKNGKTINAKETYCELVYAGIKRIMVIDGWIWLTIPKKNMILMEPGKLIETILNTDF
jgi:hypothetical protein